MELFVERLPRLELKQEHQSVLDSINQALRLVESSPMSSSPSQQHSHAHCASSSPYTQQQQPLLHSSSPTTARLRDRISAVCASTPPRQTIRPLPSTSGPSSSPLTASVEKSHITFEILRDVENQSSSRLNRSPAAKPTRHVHFSGSSELDLSQASQEYLRKYNLLQ